jgi:hypothetical protein
MEAETKTIKPIHVSGYIRNKKALETQRNDRAAADKAQTTMGAITLVGTVAIVALILWKVTLTVAVAAALIRYGYKRLKAYRAAEAEQLQIPIYYMGREVKTWQKRLHLV